MIRYTALLAAVLFFTVVNSYEVERNVHDYGARGDGVTDDTAAIIRALTEERGSDPHAVYPNAMYPASTLRPAFVFFPPGIYVVTQTLPVVYYTQMVGDADNLPTIKLVSRDSSKDIRVLESMANWYKDPEQSNFYKQIRNFIIDMTECARCTGVHWQVAQATSLTNIYFKIGGPNNQGLWMENGSGGYMSDLVFDGGKFGLWIGNQQFTSRNITIKNASIAGVFLNWDWVWSFVGLSIFNCPIGIDVAGHPGVKPAGVGSLVIVDSRFDNCTIGIRTHYDQKSPMNTLVLDNVNFNPLGAAVQNGDQVVLKTQGTVRSWVQGRVWENGVGKYDTRDLSNIAPTRSKLLTPYGNQFYQKPRPNYPKSTIINVVTKLGFRNYTDITSQFQSALTTYKDQYVLYFPAGTYFITDTVYMPPGTRIVGQVWSVFMVDGPNFSDAAKPRTVLRVGNPGEKGVVHFQDILFSAKGPHPGAKFVEWNMGDPKGQPGSCGMWDCHFRIGGAVGTDINPSNCPRGDGTGAPVSVCNGIWGMLHITKTGNGIFENVWGWTADHDIDNAAQTNINVYTARGFLCESPGPVWLYGTAFEHNYLYQYSFVSASNVLMSAIQTETAYYQPSKLTPFERTDSTDPVYCTNDSRCNMGYAVHVKDSSQIYTFGTGLYSFFNVWDQTCLKDQPNCQMEMVKVVNSKQVYTHALNTYGSVYMKTQAEDYSISQDQDNTFCSSAAVDLNLF